MRRYWNSTATIDRRRLMPPMQILVFGLLVLAALLALHAGPTLQQRLQASAFSDPLSMAYLNAWLRAQPDDQRLRLTLAYREVTEGRLDAAARTLAPLLADSQGDDAFALEAQGLQLDLLSQALWRETPGTPGFARARAAVLAQMEKLARLPLPPATLEQYANQAIALDAPEQALLFYRRLLARQPVETVRVSADIAALQLARGHYRAAAAIDFLAMQRALSLAERRRLFLAGLAALQAGNLLDEALAAAARLGPLLGDDPDTLRYLTRLARSANRPDLAERYVDRLLYPSRSDRGGRP